MAKLPCHVCGRAFPDAVLLYGDDGRICAECEAAAEEAQEAEGRIWSLAIGGPLLAFAASAGALGGCVPLVGALFVLVAPLFALMGMVAGGRAVHAGITRPQGITDQQAGILIACGVLSIPWSAAAGLWSLMMLVVQIGQLIAFYA